MAASMWSALESGGVNNGGPLATVTTISDSLLNHQLASALSTMGDAQFWEESISPTQIRQSLADADPSNPSHTHTLLRGMKWLLASISKGRNVSDYYSHVVKLVGAHSLQVRKLVYMYLVQYADHDVTTRELSLLSINSFQRGLVDAEPLIRALALRVLTSIRLPDIVPLQILGAQKCGVDKSPYVRKCAANAIAKLYPRRETPAQEEILWALLRRLLDAEDSTMVMTSALIAWAELGPHRLDFLHASFRKICHLLTDMDEWGQVVIIDLLARYCRQFFKEPVAWQHGTAERIDRQRRVVRRVVHPAAATGHRDSVSTTTSATSAHNVLNVSTPTQKSKQRVVQKGFYSDEEDDDSSEGHQPSMAANERNSLVLSGHTSAVPAAAINTQAEEDADLAEDHRLLLRSAMPLLKSRNAGVVLAVCSLQYYCGVSSVKVRSALGKALVRIHRDRREIQYVVLSSIRTLAKECPSAFSPFLHDFFIKAMDPPFTRLIKLDILTSLALEPAAVEAVLNELRNYIRHGDKTFAAEAIRAVGRVAELARIVYDRHGSKAGHAAQDRAAANRVALNCLYGLVALTQTSDSKKLVGESVIVMQWILQLLSSDAGPPGDWKKVEDPNKVQESACRRIFLLLINTLESRTSKAKTDGGEDNEEMVDDDDTVKDISRLEKLSVVLPASATASALWFVGEALSRVNTVSAFAALNFDPQTRAKLRLEIARLIARSFPELQNAEKEQGIHFCTKLIISKASGVVALPDEGPVCELVLAMSRVDVNLDVRDRARFESGLVRMSVGLHHDLDAIEDLPANTGNISVDDAMKILLQEKPAVSSLPLEDESSRSHAEMGDGFRFGTLSSLVGHRARSAYLPLPKWASQDSDQSLRDPPKVEQKPTNGGKVDDKAGSSELVSGQTQFYADSASSSSSEDEDDSSTSSDKSSTINEQSRDSSSDSSSSSDDSSAEPVNMSQNNGFGRQTDSQKVLLEGLNGSSFPSRELVHTQVEDVSDEDSSSSDGSVEHELLVTSNDNLLPMGTGTMSSFLTNGSAFAEDMKGLALAPVVTDAEVELTGPDLDRDSSAWIQLVRPEHSGGLSVQFRYLRGATYTQQAQLLGVLSPKPCFVCLQFQFQNVKTDATPFRHIRLAQRATTKNSTIIGVKKAYLPQEIAALAPGEKSEVIVGIEFASTSDREGSLQAKLEIKYGAGGIPIDIKPSLGDSLLRCQISVEEFDSAIRRLQGFQRVELSFSNENIKRAVLTKSLIKAVALTPVGKLSWQNDQIRLAGRLPASSDPLYVLISCSEEGQGKLVVCCDHALALNGIANSLKRAIQNV